MSGRSKYGKMRDWIRENAEKVKDREELAAQCLRKFGAPRKRVFDALLELRRSGVVPLGVLISTKMSTMRTMTSRPKRDGKGIFRLSVDVSEIKREYDEEAKIVDGIEALGTRLIKDNDFRMELDVPIDRWKIVSALAKFAPYKKELKGKRFRGVFWGSPGVVKELSKKIDML